MLMTAKRFYEIQCQLIAWEAQIVHNPTRVDLQPKRADMLAVLTELVTAAAQRPTIWQKVRGWFRA
jgi:hypothetical protein